MSEQRAIDAALANPQHAFVPSAGRMAMHVADRHVERWAPEAGAHRVRSLRSLSFVDRRMAPLFQQAQRLIGQFGSGWAERETAQQVSWVFPRPWYQDELDWMAAARAVGSDPVAAPARLLTTRGTYVAPPSTTSMPVALHEYVAPSLSLAPPHDVAMPAAATAYSPLVPFAASHAAEVIARAIAPLVAGDRSATRMSPNLRAVMASVIDRAAASSAVSLDAAPSRVSFAAPELVTPPSPREPVVEGRVAGESFASVEAERAVALAAESSAQRERVVELQRIARVATQREVAAFSVGVEPPAPAPQTAVAQTAVAQTAVAAPAELQARIAQRLAERAAERAAVEAREAAPPPREEVARPTTLHERARDAAVRDARAAALAPAPVSVAPVARQPEPESVRAPSQLGAALAASIGSLPPALASAISAAVDRRPDQAVRAIAELGEALRAVEMIAHSAAAGRSFETVRGPRVMLPAGLGALAATVERTQPLGDVRAPSPIARDRAAAPERAAMAFAARVPAASWIVPRVATVAAPASSALAATTAARPTALHHVAWADRWLARFAGARTASLDAFTATTATPELQLAALAAAAPASVFVAWLDDAAPIAARADDAELVASSPTALPTPNARTPIALDANARRPAARFDDAAETPDDVLAAISAAVTRTRHDEKVARSRPAQTEPTVPYVPRDTYADVLVRSVPSAPDAGLSAQLGASPFAASLRHLMPVAATPTFDVRALFGDRLAATYLAGVLAPATHAIDADVEVATLERAERAPLPWEASYVARDAIGPAGDAAIARGYDTAVSRDYVAADDDRAITAAISSEEVAAFVTRELARPSALRSELLAPASAAWSVARAIERAEPTAPVAYDDEAAPVTASSALREALRMPLLGDELAAAVEPSGVAWMAPGVIAERAHSWSVAQERSSGELSYDFVTPELVLAARVYGLGPAEAAQAARLAIAGPGQLAAMASAVDRTFVQMLSVDAERRDDIQRVGERREIARVTTSYPTSVAPSAEVDDGAVPSITTPAPMATPAPIAAATPRARAGYSALERELAATTFGVDRRAPRGAFLWPPATVAALGLSAAEPDGQLSMTVAALELLAARAVAEIGTYATAPESIEAAGAAVAGATPSRARTLATPSGDVAGDVAGEVVDRTSAGVETSESAVLASALSNIPTARRAKFEALYTALADSPTARSWSPAARAARALALAGRGGEIVSARERAAIAWDVLPVVVAAVDRGGDALDDAAVAAFDDSGRPLSTGAMASRAIGRTQTLLGSNRPTSMPSIAPETFVGVDGRPGLSALSARAGEALGSYVAPATAPAARESVPQTSRSEAGAVMRVPTAAQELVRTGRPAGRHGGGEVEIPSWFESAARKMLDDRSGTSGDMSLAELTLVTAAPAAHVAASTRSAPSTAPASPGSGGKHGGHDKQVDVEKVANEVYRHILVLMDIARARNGEPYL